MLNSAECCTREEILRECHVFVSDLGISDSAFGRAAVGDGSLIARLRAGKDINTKKLDKLRAYMHAERLRRAEAGARRGSGVGMGRPDQPPCQGAYLSEAEAQDLEDALEGAPSRWSRLWRWLGGGA